MNFDAENITAARLRHEATSAAARVVAATRPAEADSHAAESDSNPQSDSAAAKSSQSMPDSRAAHTSASDQKRERQVRRAAASKLRAQKQRRQFRRAKDSAQNALMKIEDHENDGHAYTKPCGGILLYQSVHGPISVAVTSKLTTAFKQKGGLRQINELADEHGWRGDVGRNDPSMLTIVSKWMSNIFGQDSQQPEHAKISGEMLPKLTMCNAAHDLAIEVDTAALAYRDSTGTDEMLEAYSSQGCCTCAGTYLCCQARREVSLQQRCATSMVAACSVIWRICQQNTG